MRDSVINKKEWKSYVAALRASGANFIRGYMFGATWQVDCKKLDASQFKGMELSHFMKLYKGVRAAQLDKDYQDLVGVPSPAAC